MKGEQIEQTIKLQIKLSSTKTYSQATIQQRPSSTVRNQSLQAPVSRNNSKKGNPFWSPPTLSPEKFPPLSKSQPIQDFTSSQVSPSMTQYKNSETQLHDPSSEYEYPLAINKSFLR